MKKSENKKRSFYSNRFKGVHNQPSSKRACANRNAVLYNPENAVQRENAVHFIERAYKEAFHSDSHLENYQKLWKLGFNPQRLGFLDFNQRDKPEKA